MRISERVAVYLRIMEEEGDLEEFRSDMIPTKPEDIQVVVSEDHGKFVHLGEW
jgi:hypothetical protein